MNIHQTLNEFAKIANLNESVMFIGNRVILNDTQVT